MPTSHYFTRLVNLEPLDYRIVHQFADEKGLGGKGFFLDLCLVLCFFPTMLSILAVLQE